MSGNRACAIIPARGHSKGILRKNLALLAGKPLIGWTIEAARQARLVDRIIVSTEDPEIAATAQQFGADVVRRPDDLSGDTASSESALLHALDELEQKEMLPELLVFLQCTSPLTLPEDIDGTIEVLLDENADTSLAVIPFHYFLWKRGPDGMATGVNHDPHVRLLRQQRDPDYLETGAVYVMRTKPFRQRGHRFFGKTAMYVMPVERRWEIDEPLDLQIAGLLLEQRIREDRALQLPEPIDAVVMDFDGVFTDNRVYVATDGSEMVACSRSDGWGLSQLRATGVPILVLSKETNQVVARRCEKLGLEYQQGIDDKLQVLQNWLKQNAFSLERTVFVGNDVNDLPCMRAVGCSVAVADAYPLVKESATMILTCKGGQGAVRELCDLVLRDRANSGHST